MDMRALRRPHAVDPAAGIAAAVLLLAGFGLLGKPPSPDAASAEVVGYLADHRDGVFAGALLVGAGSALFVWFLAALGAALSPTGYSAPALAGTLAGTGGAVLVVGALGVLAGLVLHVDSPRGPDLTVVGFDIYNALITIAGVLFAASIVGLVVGGGRHGTLAGALRGIGAFVAVLQLATLPGLFAESGFFAAGGVMALLAFCALAGWFVLVAVAMWRGSLGGRAEA